MDEVVEMLIESDIVLARALNCHFLLLLRLLRPKEWNGTTYLHVGKNSCAMVESHNYLCFDKVRHVSCFIDASGIYEEI